MPQYCAIINATIDDVDAISTGLLVVLLFTCLHAFVFCPNVATEPIHYSRSPMNTFFIPLQIQNALPLYKVIEFLEHPSSTSLFDVCIFNHLAAANCQTHLSACFRSHDRESIRSMNNMSIKLSIDRLPPALGMSGPTEHYIQVHYSLQKHCVVLHLKAAKPQNYDIIRHAAGLHELVRNRL